MDPARFDTLARAMTQERSRRSLALALGGALGALARTADDATTKGKRKRKRKKRRCPQLQRRCGDRCVPITACCGDAECANLGVGGVPAGMTCQQGTCRCPADKPVIYCTGTCQQCCTVEDCRPAGPVDDGQECRNGQCVCVFDGTRRCPAGSKQAGLCGHCCDDRECSAPQVCTTLGAFEPSCFWPRAGEG